MRLRRRLGAAALAAGLAVLPLGVAAQGAAGAVPSVGVAGGETRLSVAQARDAMRQAAARGDAPTAALIGRGLTAGGVEDGQVSYILAQAEMALGRPDAALDAAAVAYRLAASDLQRFESAQVSARAALAADRPTAAQLWLRRTYQNTDDAAAREAIARDFDVLRAINPLHFRLAFGASPSSNLNNGSQSRLNVIDGVPVVGVLSPTAQALSGIEYYGDLQLGYRLGAARRDRRISVEGRLYTRRVHLSEEARRLAPGARNGDFAYTLTQVGLRARFADPDGLRYGGGLTGGQSWYGGATYYHFARASLDWARSLGTSTDLSLDGSVERRVYDRQTTRETVVQAGLGLSHVLPGGATLGARIGWTSSDLTGITRDSDTVTARLAYAPAQPLGPVSLTLGVSASLSDYPDYAIGFIAVPGGRQDRSIGADVSITFDALDYAGFVPTLSLGARRTTSNVSRFETEEFTAGIGIRSAF